MAAKELSKDKIELLAKRAGISEKEVVEFYAEFIKEFPDGNLNRAGMVKMFKEIFPNQKVDKFASFAFKAFDENNDGKLSFDEFLVGVMLFAREDGKGNNLTEEEKKKQFDIFFKLFDINNDGQVSAKELRKTFDALGPLVGEDIKLTKQEIDLLVLALDTDNSKTLSKQEFAELIKDMDLF